MCKIFMQQSSKILGVHLKAFTHMKTICGLNHIPLITNDVGSLLTGLSALWISLLWKECSCVLLIKKKKGFSFPYWFTRVLEIFWIQALHWYLYSNYRLPLCGLHFHRLNGVFWWTEVLNFIEQLMNYFFLVICVCACAVFQKHLLKENCFYTQNTCEWNLLNFFPSNQPISQSWNTNQVSYNLTRFWH